MKIRDAPTSTYLPDVVTYIAATLGSGSSWIQGECVGASQERVRLQSRGVWRTRLRM